MWAKAPPQSVSVLEELAHNFIQNASAEGSKRVERSAMNSFKAFAHEFYKQRPVLINRPRFYGDMETSAHNEISLCLFACYMTNIGLQTSTVCTYTSLVRTGLQREYGFPLTLSGWEFRLPRLLKGMKKQFARIRKKRLGFRAKHQRLLHDYFRSRGTEHTPKVLLIHALFATGRQCLARSIEMCPNKAADMDPAKHMTVGDVDLASADGNPLVSEDGIEYIQVWLFPAKKGTSANEKVPVPLPKGDGIADAFSCLKRYLRDRTAREGTLKADAPLFALNGATVRTGHILKLLKDAIRVLGLDPAEFGTHSLRIGGGTDHFVGGTPPLELQIAGRWDSDIWQAILKPTHTHSLTPSPIVHAAHSARRSHARRSQSTPFS